MGSPFTHRLRLICRERLPPARSNRFITFFLQLSALLTDQTFPAAVKSVRRLLRTEGPWHRQRVASNQGRRPPLGRDSASFICSSSLCPIRGHIRRQDKSLLHSRHSSHSSTACQIAHHETSNKKTQQPIAHLQRHAQIGRILYATGFESINDHPEAKATARIALSSPTVDPHVHSTNL